MMLVGIEVVVSTFLLSEHAFTNLFVRTNFTTTFFFRNNCCFLKPGVGAVCCIKIIKFGKQCDKILFYGSSKKTYSAVGMK